MTSITQKIPNLIGGISQQPDELMPPGSVRDAVNVIPDVTDGLKKRSGSRLINPLLTTKEGSWFHFNYSDLQKYIGKVNYDGTVHVFNIADGLPVPVFYKDWEYESGDGTTGFPDCDPEAVAKAKDDWQKKLKEYQDLLNEINKLTIQLEQSGKEETDVRVRVERDRSVLEKRFFVYEGHVKKNGKDFIIPETNGKGDGWKQRRGDIVRLGGEELRNVTAMVWRVFDDFEGWQKYSPVSIYENVFYKEGTPDTALKELIETKKEEARKLKEEVDKLYDIYVAEAEKCGYTVEANSTRAIIDSDVPPKYLKHNLPMQIKSLVVGDTIFFTNPNVPTSMEQASKNEARPTENYIELLTVAPNKVYTLRLTDEAAKGTSYTIVTKVGVIDSEYQTDESTCTNDVQTEIFNDGSKVNLGIKLTVQGNSVLEGNGNSLSDYVCRYVITADITNGGANWQVGDVVEIEAAGRKHKVRVEEVETKYDPSARAYIFPPQTPNGADAVVRAEKILEDIESAIKGLDANFRTQIIGNGIYVTHTDKDYVFSFETPEGQLMNIITSEVNNIANLPTQCKGGYVVKVANTDSEFDDYWAKFVTEYNGIDGPGVWEETVAPGYNTVINAGSMPHKMTRTREGMFVVSPISWEPRLVGDDTTNPRPSFISRLSEGNYRYINKMVFFRNRLCMLSGDNVVCSRPGDYYNFFKGSALQLVDNDPIDIAVGSTSSSANAALLDALEIAEGLLTFTENEQHVLSTDSEVFSPTTARFNRVGTYRFTGQTSREYTSGPTVEPVVRGAHAFSLGNSVGFLSDAGLNSKLMEIYNIGRAAEASANELSKPVSRLVPYGINAIADSKDNNLIALSKRDTKDVWVYRYFDNDQQRLQSAWFRWRMLGTMVYHCIMDDVYWYVSIGTSSSKGIPADKRDIVSLQRIDLKDELATAFVSDQFTPSEVAGAVDLRDEFGRPFEAHLDNYRIVQPSEGTVYNHFSTGDGTQTYFRAPLVYYKDEADAGNLVAYMLSPTQLQQDSPDYGPDKTYYFVKIGSAIPVKVEEDNLGTWFVMQGDWSKTRMMIGYQVEMKVELPTLYPVKRSLSGSTLSDTRSSLTLHRLKINFGQTGVYESTIKVRGRDDYTELYECKTMDEYVANEVAFDQVKTQTIPVYAKNTDTKIIISSTHPSPATINSMEWEGDYTSKYYKRV